MNIEVLVALISAGVAVCGAVMSAFTTTRSIRLQHAQSLQRARLERLEAQEDLTRRYREPLLLAAFNLQSRIYNIVGGGFVARHMNSADPEERGYARASTLYRVGEYFGWIEILRRDLQFLDLGEGRKTAELVERLDVVSHAFSNTEWFPASVFRLFRDEQRALGEVMIEPAARESGRYQCIGYATFVERLERDAGFTRWFSRLNSEVDKLIDPTPGQPDRLIEVHRALINVISFLDADGIRFPVAHIKHLDAVSPPRSQPGLAQLVPPNHRRSGPKPGGGQRPSPSAAAWGGLGLGGRAYRTRPVRAEASLRVVDKVVPRASVYSRPCRKSSDRWVI